MCDFPAKYLLLEMRRVAREADAAKNPSAYFYAANYAKATNELRMAHEDVTDCQCWYEAVKEVDGAPR